MYQIMVGLGLLISFWLLTPPSVQTAELKFNILSELNGKGLEADQKILSRALKELGHQVYLGNIYDEPPTSEVDINIFFQSINPSWLPYASLNWFIPNAEWYTQDLELLDLIDLVLCRTQETQRIFENLKLKCFFLGFTSHDCYLSHIKKDFSLFFHLAGGSEQKGTQPIVDSWLRNSSFPLLIILKHFCTVRPRQANLHWITHRVEEPTLRDLQNSCGIHLCLSETEGFGHYIMEALSTRAVVVTVDAPPMNEFIKDPRCLVPFKACSPQLLGTNYYVDPVQLEVVINNLKELPIKELRRIGLENRAMYLKKTYQFTNSLKKLIDSVK